MIAPTRTGFEPEASRTQIRGVRAAPDIGQWQSDLAFVFLGLAKPLMSMVVEARKQVDLAEIEAEQRAIEQRFEDERARDRDVGKRRAASGLAGVGIAASLLLNGQPAPAAAPMPMVQLHVPQVSVGKQQKPRISADKRAYVLELLGQRVGSHTSIAKTAGVSPSSVHRIAKAIIA
jgi:hypothetical protein